MKLKVGDIVEFKNYADMSVDDTALIMEDRFPESGKVTEVNELDNELTLFSIEGSPYNFYSGSVARVISDVYDIDINSLKPGDEVLVKATIKDTFNEFVELIPLLEKSDIFKKIKRKEPEHFIVKEDYYGMYVNGSEALVVNKDDAKIFDSRNEANEVAAVMHLNAWEVIPYDD
jgi:hypothetical protein|nr:MAG TPA: hypothetical protein [Caudoviricetes sp.]